MILLFPASPVSYTLPTILLCLSCSREYVARILVQNIPEIQQADAYLVMQKAHKQGMAVVGVWVFEMAEAYCDGLKSGGLIASITEEDD